MADTSVTSKGDTAELPLDAGCLARCIRHIIYHDLKRGDAGEGRTWANAARMLILPEVSDGAKGDARLGEDGIGLDSLARLSAATAVSRFFDLGASGLDDYLMFEDTIGGWAEIVARHIALRGDAATIVFETSGSTDKPSVVQKPLIELLAEVDALLGTVLPNAPRRVVALAPPQHIFGFLFTALLPVRVGVPVHDATFRGAGSTLRRLVPGDIVIGTPFNWTTLLSAGRCFPPGVVGITSAGAMPRPLWDELADAGLAAVSEIFGSTETGGIGWRRDGDTPFALLPHVVPDGDFLRSRCSGRTLVLQDHLDWKDSRHFLPSGRIDRAVQIAGVNVSLAKVRSTLCACDGVADAVVRRSGDRLKAFVVPASAAATQDALASALDVHARKTLAPVARPVSYSFGSALPRNEMGKLSDW